MKNFNGLNEAQLSQLLNGVNKLADAMNANKASSFSGDDATRPSDLDEAERSAREYAKSRAKGGTMPRHESGISNEEKSIADETRAWIARQRKRGWWGNK